MWLNPSLFLEAAVLRQTLKLLQKPGKTVTVCLCRLNYPALLINTADRAECRQMFRCVSHVKSHDFSLTLSQNHKPSRTKTGQDDVLRNHCINTTSLCFVSFCNLYLTILSPGAAKSSRLRQLVCVYLIEHSLGRIENYSTAIWNINSQRTNMILYGNILFFRFPLLWGGIC